MSQQSTNELQMMPPELQTVIANPMEEVTDVMLDLETLGTDRGCIVLSAGAVRFDRHKGVLRPDGTYVSAAEHAKDPRYAIKVVFSLTRQMQAGLTASKDTLDWYYKQGGGKLSELVASGASTEELLSSLARLHGFFLATQQLAGKDCCIWANSPNFDVEIIKVLYNIYSSAGLVFPFHFRKWMDVRTIRDSQKMLLGKTLEGDRNAIHDPISDCVYQIDTLRTFWSTMRLNKANEVSTVAELTSTRQDLRVAKEDLATMSDHVTTLDNEIVKLKKSLQKYKAMAEKASPTKKAKK